MSERPDIIFEWDNFEANSERLIGTPNAKTTIESTAFGTLHKIEADDEFCSGRIELIDHNEELKIVLIDCIWFQDHTFKIKDGDWIRFNFSLSIDIDMHLSSDKAVKIVKPSWRIINYPPDQLVIEQIPANKRSAWVTICCKQDMIEKLTGDNFENLPNLLQDTLSLSDEESFHNFHEFTARLNAITADILKTRLGGALRMAYIKARTIELICHALDHLIYSTDKMQLIKLSSRDEQALAQAHEILLKEYSPAPSISALSRHLGINRNKLFYGFKIKYGCSVSDFIQSQRLEEGKRLLQHTELSITDIAAQVGFNHQSNFATAMKRHFGLTPKQFRD